MSVISPLVSMDDRIDTLSTWTNFRIVSGNILFLAKLLFLTVMFDDDDEPPPALVFIRLVVVEDENGDELDIWFGDELVALIAVVFASVLEDVGDEYTAGGVDFAATLPPLGAFIEHCTTGGK